MKTTRIIILTVFLIAVTAPLGYSRTSFSFNPDVPACLVENAMFTTDNSQAFDEATADLDILDTIVNFTEGRIGVICFAVKGKGVKSDNDAKDLMAKYALKGEQDLNPDAKVVSESSFTLGRYKGTTYVVKTRTDTDQHQRGGTQQQRRRTHRRPGKARIHG